MTITRGGEWGSPVASPVPLRIASSDAELHRLVNAARREGSRCAAALVAGGGDLARTVAASRDASQLADGVVVTELPIDIGRAEFAGQTVWFCCHAVVRCRGWRAWRGSLTAVMNAQFIGSWDVAPRGHPNDGRLDVVATTGRFGLRQRLQARRRLVTGTHLPHPSLSESRVKRWQGSVDPGQMLLLDGVGYAHSGPITIAVEPDAMVVYI